MSENGIQISLFDYFKDTDQFTLKEAETYVSDIRNGEVKLPSIRARIYEGIDKGIFKRISKGVYQATKGKTSCLMINGDGRDLSFIKNSSIDAIITDHPYEDLKSNKGGNRNFATYETFQYTNTDFEEKCRVLKKGGFLVEFLPEENANNYEYLYRIKEMAKKSGLEYYAKVPWKKGSFIANTGRKSKNNEDVMFFTKGKARELRLDSKKTKNAIDGKEYRMSGTNGMLPVEFNYQPPTKKERLHQAEKPVELIEEILDYITLEEELVLDQFAGSMNVGKASLNKNRNSIVMELDPTTFENGESSFSKIEKVFEDIEAVHEDEQHIELDSDIEVEELCME